MRDKVRKLLLKNEDLFRLEVRTEPIANKAYELGCEYDLSYQEMALLCIPYLFEELRRLRAENQKIVSFNPYNQYYL